VTSQELQHISAILLANQKPYGGNLVMLRTLLIAAVLLLLLPPPTLAQSLDKLPDVHPLSDAQLEHFLQHAVRWLGSKARETNSSPLKAFVEQLQLLLQPVCTRCIDYFQAVALVRGLSKSVRQVIEEGRNDVYYPAIRRSYVAAIWLLQRSKMFVWQTTHLDSNALGTMLRWAAGSSWLELWIFSCAL
jgi:hypothetical protein